MKLPLVILVMLPSVTVTDKPHEPSQLLAWAVLKISGPVLGVCIGNFEDTFWNTFRAKSSEENAPHARRPVTADAFRKSRRLIVLRVELPEEAPTCEKCFRREKLRL